MSIATCSNHNAALSSLGIRQSPRGDSATEPPSNQPTTRLCHRPPTRLGLTTALFPLCARPPFHAGTVGFGGRPGMLGDAAEHSSGPSPL
ncbi:MAG: hypothetical protein HY741_27020 [Chloroflexi bacterium]|nr:hypothetical protein [Chloroflexota bacterium]